MERREGKYVVICGLRVSSLSSQALTADAGCCAADGGCCAADEQTGVCDTSQSRIQGYIRVQVLSSCICMSDFNKVYSVCTIN